MYKALDHLTLKSVPVNQGAKQKVCAAEGCVSEEERDGCTCLASLSKLSNQMRLLLQRGSKDEKEDRWTFQAKCLH
jgi:hypothetical protein